MSSTCDGSYAGEGCVWRVVSHARALQCSGDNRPRTGGDGAEHADVRDSRPYRTGGDLRASNNLEKQSASERSNGQGRLRIDSRSSAFPQSRLRSWGMHDLQASSLPHQLLRVSSTAYPPSPTTFGRGDDWAYYISWGRSEERYADTLLRDTDDHTWLYG